MRKQLVSSVVAAGLALMALPMVAALPPQYEGTPTQKDYPQADVLVLSESHSFTLMPDGRVDSTVRTVLKPLTYEGVNIVGDPKVAFNSAAQELKVLRSRTYTPEGAAVDTQANGFTEMTPFALEKAPAYTDIRQMVITHVGLDVGSVVDREVAVTDKVAWRRFLDVEIPLRGEHPALVRTVVVAVPEGTPLTWTVQGGTGQPERTKDAGRDLYTWTWKDVPALLEAGASPAEMARAPRLLASTCRGWGGQVESLAPLVEKAVAAVSPEMKKQVEALLKDASGEEDKLSRLLGYAASSFRTVHWPLADFDARPRGADEIYDSGYGHSLDRAVLLAAFLRLAGFDPTVGMAGPDPDAGVPCVATLDEALVRVDVDGRPVAVDPTAKLSERSQKDLAGLSVLPLRAGFDATHPVPALGAPDLLDVAIEAKACDKLGLEGSATLSLDGWYSPYWSVRGCEEELRSTLGSLLSGLLPGAEVTGASVVRMEPGRCTFKATFKVAPPEATPAGKILRTGTPGASALEQVHGWYRSDRDLPCLLPCAAEERLSLTVKLPEGVEPKVLPKGLDLSNAAGKVVQSATFEGGTLTLKRSLSVPQREIPASGWTALRSLRGALASAPANLVVF